MSRKTTVFSAIALNLFVLLLSACNSKSVKIVEALGSGYEYEGKKVELVGEFNAPYFTFMSGRSTVIPMAFVVKSHAMSSEKHSISDVILNLGTGKNTVLLDMAPDQKQYTLKNFFVFDNNGVKYNLDEHPEFKITGTVNYSELKKPEGERDNKNFSFKLTDVAIEKD
ncbi:hypothetical protein [Pedobacter nutrimenti]|uniref:hypothetical protein n=1 Tax=Pedobacter nutrimenti TaxID=1241337 RepID=UPI0029307559|nr:hypothetical protein [Pedobacter nutrimenti]